MDDIKVPKVDPNRCGPDIRQGVNNRISGSGTALCNTNVLQDRMYFEVKIINPDGTPNPSFSIRPADFLPRTVVGVCRACAVLPR